MMKVETSALIGSALDWAVAQLEKPQLSQTSSNTTALRHGGAYAPSTDWSQGGPIIDREKISVMWRNIPNESYWYAEIDRPLSSGENAAPLVAAMRCFVASKLGNDVEVPDELA